MSCAQPGAVQILSYVSKSEVSNLLEQEIISKSKDHPRYGYRRITAVLRRDGYLVNAKLTQRVRRIEGLQVKKK